MDIRKIKKLIDMFESAGIAEIEIHEGEESVRISRYGPQAPMAAPMPYPYPMPPSAPANPTQTLLTIEGSSGTEPAPKGHPIKSPMVGTFYRAATPTSKPFIEEGQSLKEGDTLCIIEAMKILNQIVADRAGVITRILVENGSPVEYDQPLFILE